MAARAGGSRRHRLSGPAAFEALFRCGRRREGEFLQFVFHPAAGEWGRVGFVIGRKVLPRAVDRNRVRRMLRVLLRNARPSLDRLDLVVRLKKPAARAEFPRIVTEADRLIAALASETPPR